MLGHNTFSLRGKRADSINGWTKRDQGDLLSLIPKYSKRQHYSHIIDIPCGVFIVSLSDRSFQDTFLCKII